ncbi:MAG: SDR family NAD(P)-dependent oxidoreductase [Bacillaceae bacterium]
MGKKWLENKVVVITGASSGIGEQVAIRVHQEGGIVILLARSENALIALKERLGSRCYYYLLDVKNENEVKATFSRIYNEIGFIDVLVNNAGIGFFKSFTQTTVEDAQAMFDVNVFGLMYCTQAVLPAMIQEKRGQVIQVGSMAGKVATPKSSIYAATKHAVLGLTNALRLELDRTGVTVTTINPGPVKTAFLKKADTTGNYEKNAGTFMLERDKVAEKIVATMGKNVREVNIPKYFSLGAIFYAIAPKLFEKVGKKALNSK